AHRVGRLLNSRADPREARCLLVNGDFKAEAREEHRGGQTADPRAYDGDRAFLLSHHCSGQNCQATRIAWWRDRLRKFRHAREGGHPECFNRLGSRLRGNDTAAASESLKDNGWRGSALMKKQDCGITDA